ncbi:prefoldin subunit alpha, partial [archaeon]|nr:prefoldin subunit alpha [archaeon]
MAAKTEKDHERELQAKYFQYQIMKQQMTAYMEEKAVIDERINELSMTIDALHKIDDVKNGNEMWSSLGSGAFVRSDIKDVQKAMISLGAGVVVKETKERCIEILQSRLEEI